MTIQVKIGEPVKVETKTRATLREAEIRAAALAFARKGGDIFDEDVSVDTVGAVGDTQRGSAVLSISHNAMDAAVTAYLAGGKFVPTSALTWGVDEQGIFCAVDVEPAPRKTRAKKGAE